VFGRGGNTYSGEIKCISEIADLKTATVQEIGAGTGNHAAALLTHPVRSVVLVDFDLKAVEILKRRFTAEKRVTVVAGNGFRQQYAEKYDLVYAMYSIVLQEISDISGLKDRLNSIMTRLHNGGCFIFEIIDADISEHIYPQGSNATIYRDLQKGNEVTVTSMYDRNTLTIAYEGTLNYSKIDYEVQMLRVNRQSVCNAVREVFGKHPSVYPLDEKGRRLLFKAEAL